MIAVVLIASNCSSHRVFILNRSFVGVLNVSNDDPETTTGGRLNVTLNTPTLRKYIQSPVQTPARCQRTSKIDPFKATVADVLEPGSYNCASGKVNSADKLCLVLELVKPDVKHNRSSSAPVPVYGAER
jgi:hypothetical protein